MTQRRVCLVSSGTGGHLWPALVLADALRNHGHEPMLVTEGRLVERELLERVGSDALALPLRGRGIGRVLRLPSAIRRARRLLVEHDVRLVLGTGGAISAVVGLAARSLGVPVCLLELNATIGRGNRWLLPFARRIYTGLELRRPHGRALWTGTPIRKEFGSIDRADARRDLGLDETRPVVLVTGGSQGAASLNTLVPEALVGLRRPLQVLHLTGTGRDEPVRRAYAEGHADGVDAIVRAMAVEMAELYAAADVVICRGGGGTVAELMGSGRAGIIVPYPFHKDQQQLHNARVLVEAGAARLIPEIELGIDRLRSEVGELLANEGLRREMERRAGQLARGDACDRIVGDLVGMTRSLLEVSA